MNITLKAGVIRTEENGSPRTYLIMTNKDNPNNKVIVDEDAIAVAMMQAGLFQSIQPEMEIPNEVPEVLMN
jgi:hypothetical protein